MSGLFTTLNTANKGFMANQTAITTTAHNISNANTEGFSRQRVDLKADLAFNYAGVGQLGTGVKMESIVRLVDEYVSKQIRQENGTFERFTAKYEVLQQLEIIYNEPSDTGLNFNLGEMFNAWQELSKNPESLNAKTIVVEKSKTMADTINHMTGQLNDLIGDTTDLIEKNVYDFNTIVNKLDSLNKQIFNISVKGQVPNDLLDQRDLLLKDLSSIANFTSSDDKFGQIKVEIGGKQVLGVGSEYEMSMIKDVIENGDGSYTVKISEKGDSLKEALSITVTSLDFDPNLFAVGQVILNKPGQITEPYVFDPDSEDILLNPSISAGQIKGYKEALEDIKESQDYLNTFTTTMANAINTVHSYNGDEAVPSGIDFFTLDPSNPSASIKVNVDITEDNILVNTSYSNASSEGDGSRALAIASLRNTKLVFSDTFDPQEHYDNIEMTIEEQTDGVSIEDAYRDIVIKIGISKEHSENMVDNQELLLNQLELRRESTSGVSIDEEVTNLIKFQKSFEANARVIAVLTDMLDTLINRTGV